MSKHIFNPETADLRKISLIDLWRAYRKGYKIIALLVLLSLVEYLLYRYNVSGGWQVFFYFIFYTPRMLAALMPLFGKLLLPLIFNISLIIFWGFGFVKHIYLVFLNGFIEYLDATINSW